MSQQQPRSLSAIALALVVAVAAASPCGAGAAETMTSHQGMAGMTAPVAAPPGGERVAAAPNEIVIDNFAFGPKTLTVAAGTEVTWINHDDEPHTVVYSGEARLFKSPPLDTDDKFSFVFKEPGTYPYYCSIHPHMTGTIVVR